MTNCQGAAGTRFCLSPDPRKKLNQTRVRACPQLPTNCMLVDKHTQKENRILGKNKFIALCFVKHHSERVLKDKHGNSKSSLDPKRFSGLDKRVWSSCVVLNGSELYNHASCRKMNTVSAHVVRYSKTSLYGFWAERPIDFCCK